MRQRGGHVMGAMEAGAQSGFTLVEVLVVAVCVCVLAMMAYPSYIGVMRRAARAEAQSELMVIAQELERRFSIGHRYAAADGSLTGTDALPVVRSPRTGAVRYLIEGIASEGGRAYVVQARPQGAQANDGCGILGISHTGARTPELGADGRPCW